MSNLLLGVIEDPVVFHRVVLLCSSLVALLITGLALLYWSKGTSSQEEAQLLRQGGDWSKFLLTMKRLVVLDVIVLAFIVISFFLRLVYAEPRPLIEPEWVYWMSLFQVWLILFNISLPAVVLVIMVRHVRKKAGINEGRVIEKLDPERKAK